MRPNKAPCDCRALPSTLRTADSRSSSSPSSLALAACAGRGTSCTICRSSSSPESSPLLLLRLLRLLAGTGRRAGKRCLACPRAGGSSSAELSRLTTSAPAHGNERVHACFWLGECRWRLLPAQLTSAGCVCRTRRKRRQSHRRCGHWCLVLLPKDAQTGCLHARPPCRAASLAPSCWHA